MDSSRFLRRSRQEVPIKFEYNCASTWNPEERDMLGCRRKRDAAPRQSQEGQNDGARITEAATA